MPEQFNWDFRNPRDPKAEIRSAVGHLLSGISGNARADMVRDIIEIVREVADGLAPGRSDPFDDDMPGS
jgi:hypothetical protein